MKKRIFLSIIIIFLILASFYSGYYFSILNHNKKNLVNSELRLKTEHYSPTCKDLKNTGIPDLYKKGDTYIFVKPLKNYFYVIGVDVSVKSKPDFYWWGASKDFEIKEKCKIKN